MWAIQLKKSLVPTVWNSCEEGAVRVGSSGELRYEAVSNRFLFCSVLAKQTRRLGRLIPELRVAELIGVAWRNCAEHNVQVYIDGNVPKVIREQAAEMFPPAELSATPEAVGGGTLPRSQIGNGVSTIEQQRDQASPEEERSSPSHAGPDIHLAVGTGLDSADSYRNLSGFERKWSMSHANGTDRMRQLQLQAVAQNLYTLANRHRENRNFVVAHALYGRALEIMRGLESPQRSDNGDALVHKIKEDQQAIFEILRSGEVASLQVPQEKVQKAGQ